MASKISITSNKNPDEMMRFFTDLATDQSVRDALIKNPKTTLKDYGITTENFTFPTKDEDLPSMDELQQAFSLAYKPDCPDCGRFAYFSFFELNDPKPSSDSEK